MTHFSTRKKFGPCGLYVLSENKSSYFGSNILDNLKKLKVPSDLRKPISRSFLWQFFNSLEDYHNWVNTSKSNELFWYEVIFEDFNLIRCNNKVSFLSCEKKDRENFFFWIEVIIVWFCCGGMWSMAVRIVEFVNGGYIRRMLHSEDFPT